MSVTAFWIVLGIHDWSLLMGENGTSRGKCNGTWPWLNLFPPIPQMHHGPTDVEYDRPPHPKMARAVSASGLYASIVNLHALKCWLFACELTYKVHMNSCECCIYGKESPSSLYRRWQNSVGMWRTTNASGTRDVVDDNLGCGRRHLSVNISNHIKRVLICGRWISHGQLFTSEPWEISAN